MEIGDTNTPTGVPFRAALDFWDLFYTSLAGTATALLNLD